MASQPQHAAAASRTADGSIDSELRFEYATAASLTSGLGAMRMCPAYARACPAAANLRRVLLNRDVLQSLADVRIRLSGLSGALAKPNCALPG
jgi:hypothetical protein